MLNFAGEFAVILNYVCLLAAFLGVTFYFKSMTESKYVNFARISFHVTISGIILMSFILLILIINHQYQYIYIFNNTSNELPFGLLLSTFYAGQEGSFLFWLLCLAIIGIFIHPFTKKHGIEPSFMASFGIILVFLLLLLINKSPFDKIWQVFPEAIKTGEIPSGMKVLTLSASQWVMIPPDGAGLNPLLHNFWMQIHPPVLFIGFAFMAVPFAFAISALIIGEFKKWVKLAMPWLIISSFFLGAGLILGAFWAYETLGWGGYWGWDPVENSSLIPWIVSVALIHTMITQIKTGGLIKTNLFLAVMAFVLVVYSTFLTRSGVLKDSSVHSFTEPGSIVYLLLFVFLFSVLLLGVGLISFRLKDISIEKYEYKLLSKEVMLSLGSVVLSISALIILAGTSYPIFSKSAVETSFYDNWNLPLAILINIINVASLVIGWGGDDLKNIVRKIFVSLIISLASTVGAYFVGAVHFDMLLLIWSSLFAVLVNGEKMIRNIRMGALKIGGVLSHIGVALLLIGIVGSGRYGQTQHVELPIGEQREIYGYQFKYLGEEPFDNGKKSYFNVSVSESGKDETLLKPVMFMTQMANGVMRIPDIKEMLFKDIYFSPVGIDDNSSSAKDQKLELKKGEMVKLNEYDLMFDSYSMDMEKMMSGGEFSISAVLKLIKDKDVEIINVTTIFDKGGPKFLSSNNRDGKFQFELEKIVRGDKPIALIKLRDLSKAGIMKKEALIAEISIKPLINLFWLGNILMLVGFVLAYIKRRKEIV